MRKLTVLLFVGVIALASSCDAGSTVGPEPKVEIMVRITEPTSAFRSDTIAPEESIRFAGMGSATVDGRSVSVRLAWRVNGSQFGDGQSAERGFPVGNHRVCLVASSEEHKTAKEDCRNIVISPLPRIEWTLASADSADHTLRNMKVRLVGRGNTFAMEALVDPFIRTAVIEDIHLRKEAVRSPGDSVLVIIDAIDPSKRSHLPIVDKRPLGELLSKGRDPRTLWPVRYTVPKGLYEGYVMDVKLHEEAMKIASDGLTFFGYGLANLDSVPLQSWKKPVPIHIERHGFPEWEALGWEIIQKFNLWFGEGTVRLVNPAVEDTLDVLKVILRPDTANRGRLTFATPDGWITRGWASAFIMLEPHPLGLSRLDIYKNTGWAALVHEVLHGMGIGHAPCFINQLIMVGPNTMVGPDAVSCTVFGGRPGNEALPHPKEVGYVMLRDMAHRRALETGSPRYLFDSLMGERVRILELSIPGWSDF